MIDLDAFAARLPDGMAWEDLQTLCPAALWQADPETAAMLALARQGAFDCADYLSRYGDVARENMDPIEHFVRFGHREGRHFNLMPEGGLESVSAATEGVRARPIPDAVSPLENPVSQSSDCAYSIIVTLWKRKNYIREQWLAFMRQTVPPAEIIYIINGGHIAPEFVREATGSDVRIIVSGINSLYTRFALAYIAQSPYVAIMDDDVVPGSMWFANALRCCTSYGAYVVGSGRRYNRRGLHGFFTLVMPGADRNSLQYISCSRNDIFCDWGCNSYFLKREWVSHMLREERPGNLPYYTDDMQSAMSMLRYAGIPCVTPWQPLWDKRLWGSMYEGYGNDAQAFWRTRAGHFAIRSQYGADQIKEGYEPVSRRDNLFRFHIIVAFGDREWLERCLLSIKGQVYDNYTITLIDDCCDGGDSVYLLEKLGLENHEVRYILNRKKRYALAGHELAVDLLRARPADIIVHLDGDDWFSHPHVLWQLNRVYRTGRAEATIGNMVDMTSHKSRDFSEYHIPLMSRCWNMSQEEPNAPKEPVRRALPEETVRGWDYAPWWPTHTRSFFYAKWLELNRSTFRYADGRQVNFAYDAAILIPIFNSINANRSLAFVPDVGYTYQKCGNTTTAKNRQDKQEEPETRHHIFLADKSPATAEVTEFLGNGGHAPRHKASILYDSFGDSAAHSPEAEVYRKAAAVGAAVATIITPDFMVEAAVSLESWRRNSGLPCAAHVFVSTHDTGVQGRVRRLLEGSGIEPLFPETMLHTRQIVAEFEKKYGLGSDEFRWGIKAAVILELLRRGCACALFLDPDIYAVADVTDIHRRIFNAAVSLFPHFRNPDTDETREVLYKDGFYNGGMIGATKKGEKHLLLLSRRCLKAMQKDKGRNLFVDQKYLDTIPMEGDEVFINQDQGIDYNPYWNQDPVEGPMGPSQRSWLLKTGFFARVWHMAWAMIHGAAGRREPVVHARPFVAIYLKTKLLVCILLGIKAASIGMRDSFDLFGLEKEYEEDEWWLSQISAHIGLDSEYSLWEDIRASRGNSTAHLEKWANICINSICFDNLELFAQLLLQHFGTVPQAQALAEKMRRRDLRYVTEDVLGNADITAEEEAQRLEAESAGVIVQRRLDALKRARINY